MSVNLSIKNAPKNAPNDVVARLRERAIRNHRSLRGERLAIIQQAANPAPARSLTVNEYRARIAALGLTASDESAAIVRADRDDLGQR